MSEPVKVIELSALVGKHEFSGCNQDERYGTESANALVFVFDGTAFMVSEDPDDGYRSHMKDIIEVPVEACTNRFPACTVIAEMKGGSDEILVVHDFRTGKLVLEVGTSNTDDYYPSYVANFTPEHLYVNKDVLQGVTGPTGLTGEMQMQSRMPDWKDLLK